MTRQPFLTCHARRLVSCQACVRLLAGNSLVNIGRNIFSESDKDQSDFKITSYVAIPYNTTQVSIPSRFATKCSEHG